MSAEWVRDNKKKLEGIMAKSSLGRHKKNTEFIIAASDLCLAWGRVPRDYTELKDIKGVADKVALVTVHTAFGLTQGIAVDVHMLRIFRELGWYPGFKLSYKNERELCRSGVEGWFPFSEWGDMNRVYAGLGQLLNDKESRQLVVDFFLEQTLAEDSECRKEDFQRILSVAKLYSYKYSEEEEY